jgi:hypothetical protein
MKQNLVFLMAASWALLSCSSYEAPDSGLDCGRQFINATYQGNFKRAKQLLLPEPQQATLLEERIERDFRSRNSSAKEALSKASIVVQRLEQPADSVVLLTYLNAYDNQPRQLRVVNRAGNWQTDLVYSFTER